MTRSERILNGRGNSRAATSACQRKEAQKIDMDIREREFRLRADLASLERSRPSPIGNMSISMEFRSDILIDGEFARAKKKSRLPSAVETVLKIQKVTKNHAFGSLHAIGGHWGGGGGGDNPIAPALRNNCCR